MENFSFKTDQEITYEEVTLKGVKKYLVKGFASTTDPDAELEIVTDEGQDDLAAQMKNQNITFDIGHDSWDDGEGGVLQKPKDMLPVARVVKAERRKSPKNGVYIEAELNPNHPDFKAIWSSIKGKFLHAFSIAFYPVNAVKKKVKGVMHNLISKLNLVNITLTGNPINTSATFIPAMKAALKKWKPELDLKSEVEELKLRIKSLEKNKTKGDKMTEEPKKEDVPKEPVEEKTEEPKEEPKPEEKKEEETKAEPEPEKEEKKEEPEPEKETSPISTIKAEMEKEMTGLKKEIADLKARLEKPIMKAKQEEVPEQEPVPELKSVLQTIN